MRVEKRYAMESMMDVRRLIREHGWAVLVTVAAGTPQAAHVPCLLDRDLDLGGESETLVIVGHTTRADPVSRHLISRGEALLVFQGPNGYVSPAWYGEGTFIPTWNFTTVHVSGVPELLEGRRRSRYSRGRWSISRQHETIPGRCTAARSSRRIG
jgi:transcriptional regulator